MPCEDRHTQGTGYVTAREMEDAAASQGPPGTPAAPEAEKRPGHVYSPQSLREHHPASAFILDMEAQRC